MDSAALVIVIFVIGVSTVVAAGIGLVVGRRLVGRAREEGRDEALAVAAASASGFDELADAVRALAEETRREADDQRDRAIHAAVETVLTSNSAVMEQERTAVSRELEGRQALVNQRLLALDGKLDQVAGLVRSFEADRERKLGELSSELLAQRQGVESLLQTTQSLREALSSTKARGQWGERMAEDVLQLAGFVENVNYRKQTAIAGGRALPDYTFLLPNELRLHMDVKFPLDNYLRFCDATTELEKRRYREDFLRDVRARVKELTGRAYIDASGGTVDFVLLFIPNEQLYSFIHEQDGAILDDAVRHGVVFCSPLTLFAVLALVRQMVENFQLARTSDQILALLGEFSDQWRRFVGQMDKVGARLDAASKEYESLVGTRQRLLEKPLRKIDVLRSQHDSALELVGDPGADDVADIDLVDEIVIEAPRFRLEA